jgi:hypothetical protein
MSDFENPYKSPETSIVPEKTQGAGTVLTETMLGYLKEASPWTRFIGILGFIGCGLMVLGGIITAIATSSVSGITEGFGPLPVWLVSLIYIAFGVLFFFPSRFVYDFGAKIRNYQFSSSDEDLEAAFKSNKSLWKFYGIMLIVYLALIPLFIVLAVIGAVASTAGLL